MLKHLQKIFSKQIILLLLLGKEINICPKLYFLVLNEIHNIHTMLELLTWQQTGRKDLVEVLCAKPSDS